MASTTEILHQTLSVVPVVMNDFGQGIGWGWIAPTLLILQNRTEFSFTTQELSWLGSTQEIGRIIGALSTSAVIDKLGRKSMLGVCAFLYFLSWCIIASSISLYAICSARFVFGFGNGTNDVNASIYLGENFSPKLRAIFCSIAMVSVYSAELVEYVIASFFQYRVTAAINAAIAFIGFLSTCLSRETPQYLLMRGKPTEAEENHFWLKGSRNAETIDEFQRIRRNIETEKSKSISYRELLASRANYRSLIITTLLFLFITATGGTAVVSYVSVLFTNNEIFTPSQFTILFGSIRLLVSISLPFYVERLPRRSMIVGSFLFIGFVHLCTTVLYYVHMRVLPIPHVSWYVFFTITLYASLYTVLYPVGIMVKGELFPQSIKAFGGFVAASTHAACGFFLLTLFLVVKVEFGVYVNFFFFALMSFVGFIYNYRELPETRGKFLVDIQQILEKN